MPRKRSVFEKINSPEDSLEAKVEETALVPVEDKSYLERAGEVAYGALTWSAQKVNEGTKWYAQAQIPGVKSETAQIGLKAAPLVALSLYAPLIGIPLSVVVGVRIGYDKLKQRFGKDDTMLKEGAKKLLEYKIDEYKDK